MVLAAVVLLIAGFVLAKPFLIMWSIVVSVLSALFLVIGALLRRHELFPGGGRAAAPATPPAPLPPPGLPYNQTGPAGPQPHPRPQPHPHQPPPQTLQRTAVPASAPRRPAASGISPDAIVLVIPGRRRYHVPGCRQLAARDHEELTYEEAREEGFTPCTTCLPDAALGGRQLPPAADPEPAVAPGPGTTPSAVAENRAEPKTESRAENRAEPRTQSRAETSAETQDLRPPVVPPKPDTKASTPTPEPPASREEGATGWFGRPAAAAQAGDQAKQPSSAAAPDPGADSGDEQAEIQTSYFRPPHDRERPARPGSPDDAKSPSAPASSSQGKPDATSGDASSGKSDASSGESAESAPGRPSSAARPSPADRPGQSPDEDDDSSGPDTAPQPRVTSSGMPVHPQGSGGASGPSERPSGAAPAPSSGRPPSSAESEAKPTGPLPAGAPAAGGTASKPADAPKMAASPASSGNPKPSTPPKSSTPSASKAEKASEGAGSAGAGEGSKKAAQGDEDAEGAGGKGGAGAAGGRGGTVKVIVGTSRFHSTACPLIRGAGESGVETMTLAEAEAAGLTSCSVCQHDRETVK
ncbi:hypothetical protein ACIBIZ_27915 [Nonomuraea spiralis]|uniref:hypothetical protein n=1 Tax=Nonomuraea spiralis TaxID=46182 RepID=UPI0037A8603A